MTLKDNDRMKKMCFIYRFDLLISEQLLSILIVYVSLGLCALFNVAHVYHDWPCEYDIDVLILWPVNMITNKYPNFEFLYYSRK